MDYHVPNCSVQFFHYRYPHWVDNYVTLYKQGKLSRSELSSVLDLVHSPFSQPSNHGGMTRCVIDVYADDNHIKTIIGEARCSLLDCFCKRTGRDIAFGRAIKQLKEMKMNTQTFPVSSTPDNTPIASEDLANRKLETARVLDWLETDNNYHTPWACQFETDDWSLLDDEEWMASLPPSPGKLIAPEWLIMPDGTAMP